MLLPVRSKNPPESLPIATCLLIGINVLVYALTSNGFEIRPDELERWAIRGDRFDLIHNVSALFLHADLFHLLGNMWFLYLFGFAVEGRLRSAKALTVYFGAGFAGSGLQQLTLGAANPTIPSLGASGAIMGLMGAALFLFPFAQITCAWAWYYRFGTSDWPMWGVALWYVGFDLLGALVLKGDGIGHFAHLGGVSGGLVLTAAFRPRRDSEAASEAKAEFSDTKDLRMLTPADLSAMAASNPDDTTLVLNWIYTSLVESRGVSPECCGAFVRLLPEMIQREPIQTVGFVASAIAKTPGELSIHHLFEIASRLEHAGDSATVLRLYQAILNDPAASDRDQEAATFRTARIYDYTLRDAMRAIPGYEHIVRQYPMGPFANTSRARLALLKAPGSRRP
ncbi:MAG: rhomboid family intramembrane serine protease [Fimbriimonas ginsengisoli]|uniref:Rhomboid family intramembrane serine protease n=1 Tax=Fimbriimonas ginsengisoli TaxID=1005039 RepID=A0A931LUD5_FIMGI|nr:rhomboid family intramembrane serine protease [Fimbriimonas ginsengisoli]